MKLILSSCDFRNENSKNVILNNLPKPIDKCRLLFIPNEVTVTLKIVEQKERDILFNPLEKYFYEFSQYDGGKFGNQGVFGYKYIDNYFTEKSRYAYFIMVDDELAGFALLNNRPEIDTNKLIEYSIAEFFVAYNFRRQGVATKAVDLLFEKHKGYYHIKYHKKNLASDALWKKIADKYSKGKYETFVGDESFRDGTESAVLRFEVK